MFHRHRLPLAAATVLIFALGPLLSACVEIRITQASVVAGPTASGELTLHMDVNLKLDEEMTSQSEEPVEPSYAQIGYAAVVLPAGVTVQTARLHGATEMVGDEGYRLMGRAPQMALAHEEEFPTDADHRWEAFHVILDQVDLREAKTIAVELDLAGVPQGSTQLAVSPGFLSDAGTAPDPVSPTVLDLAVGAGKAVVRIAPPGVEAPAEPAGEEVSA